MARSAGRGAAVAWLESGVHIKAVADLLGHSSIAITGDIYGHTSDATTRAAIEGLTNVRMPVWHGSRDVCACDRRTARPPASSVRSLAYTLSCQRHAPPIHCGWGSASACTQSSSRRFAIGSAPSSDTASRLADCDNERYQQHGLHEPGLVQTLPVHHPASASGDPPRDDPLIEPDCCQLPALRRTLLPGAVAETPGDTN